MALIASNICISNLKKKINVSAVFDVLLHCKENCHVDMQIIEISCYYESSFTVVVVVVIVVESAAAEFEIITDGMIVEFSVIELVPREVENKVCIAASCSAAIIGIAVIMVATKITELVIATIIVVLLTVIGLAS